MAQQIETVPLLPRTIARPNVESLALYDATLNTALFNALTRIAFRLNLALMKDGSEPMSGPVVLKSYTVSTLPSASTYSGGMIYVSDETGGAVPAFSDGTNWRRVTDRVVVS